MIHVLITGGAGFIGSSLADKLLKEGYEVTSVDNFDPFYDRALKLKNIEEAKSHDNYHFYELDICDLSFMKDQLQGKYDVIVHAAAKAGVHASIKDPIGCQQANVMGTQCMLEFAKENDIKQFIFASSSSVYGVNPDVPWKESDQNIKPISPYASSKLSCEMLGHVYVSLYGLRFIALRFFSVYGPRQRPDLAITKFTQKIMEGHAIPMFGNGSSRRDYTYIEDIVQGIKNSIDYTDSDFEVINLGNYQTVSLREMIETIESTFGISASIIQLPDQPGDVPQTYADINKAEKLLNYRPTTSFGEGMVRFKNWILKDKL